MDSLPILRRRLLGFVLTGICCATPAAWAQVDGSGTAGRIPKFEDADTLGISNLFQDTSGRIGIGTASPLKTLDVKGDALVRGLLGVTRGSGQSAFIANQTGSGPIADFRLAGAVKLVMSNEGFLGIGTAAPGFPLDVAGFVRGSDGVAFGNRASVGVKGDLDKRFDFSHRLGHFSDAFYTSAFRSYIDIDSDADLTGANEKWIYGHDLETNIVEGNARDYHFVDGPFLASYHCGEGNVWWLQGAVVAAELCGPGNLENLSALDVVSDLYGSGDVVTNKGLIVRTGNRGTGSLTNDHGVYVQTPYDSGALANHYGIYLEDQARGANSYAIYSEGGRCYLSGDVGIGTDAPTNILTIAPDAATDPIARAWTTYSSRRFKENIHAIPNALETVMSLRGVAYDWKKDGRHDIGVIAEEVAEVLPEIVVFEGDGKDAKSVDYARLTAVLIEGMKEQQAQIDELKRRLEAVRSAGE